MFFFPCMWLALTQVQAQPPTPPPSRPSVNVTPPTSRTWLDLAFAQASPTQTLDIYVPEQGQGPFPVILYLHGGAFAFGSKRGPDISVPLKALSHGYAVVSANYRLSGEATFPACIDDVRDALRFIRKHAAQYQLDPNRVAAWGVSAGATLAALAGTSGKGDTRLQAVVDFYGPVNFLTMDAQFKAAGVKGQSHDGPKSFEAKLMGAPIQTIPDKVAQANATTFLTKDAPPFFIQHGTADTTIPLQQSEEFAAALKAVLGPDKVVFETLPGAAHGGEAFETTANLAKVFAFLDRHLKGGK